MRTTIPARCLHVIFRLGRYVAYDASNEAHAGSSASKMAESVGSVVGQSASKGSTGGSGSSNQDVPAPGSNHKGALVMLPATESTSREPTWPNDAMADLHLSGSDPRMFPGIFTRDHHSGNSRNLGQAEDEKPSPGNVVEGDEA